MNTDAAASESPEGAPATKEIFNTVKYSLPELLAELEIERANGSFSQEKMQQAEIGKLFQAQPKRRRVNAAT